jgi:hypothetical protein
MEKKNQDISKKVLLFNGDHYLIPTKTFLLLKRIKKLYD